MTKATLRSLAALVRSARGLALSAATAFGLLVLGMVNPGSLVVVEIALDRPWILLPATLVLGIAAIGRSAMAGWAKVIVVSGAVVTTGFVGFILLFLIGPILGDSTVPAPDNRPYEAFVVEGVAVIDPLWTISVRQRTGLLARQWDIGCVNGDDPANALHSVRWEAPQQLVLSTQEYGQVIVQVDAHGQPVDVDDPGILGCPSD